MDKVPSWDYFVSDPLLSAGAAGAPATLRCRVFFREAIVDRVIAFIDGFNFYHALLENGCRTLKWLNYRALAEAFVAPSRERLVKVFYFTAVVPWDSKKAARHRLFIQAQEINGVEIRMGKFKEVTRKCRQCGNAYKTFEEKETDVNLAVTMLLEAANDTFDKAILFSGDSDMIAGVKALKSLAPHKHVQVVVPFGRSSIDLVNSCHSSAKIKRKHLENNQLPSIITLSGGKTLTKPPEWNS
jgi:uncharacterized LabA/DUF88 family protein